MDGKGAVPGDLVRMLGEAAANIRALEAEAGRVVGQDPAAYKDLLVEKCRVLQSLPERAAPMLKGLEAKLSRSLAHSLENFAARASTALSVDSVFFMYALLYPDDYKDGDPNDLEAFISGLS